MGAESKKLSFVTWLRAIGVIFILLCHYVGVNRNAYVQMSGQFFNIGNDIFFIVSGFCFGIKKNLGHIGEWYLKRLQRIIIPYEIMVFAYLTANVLLGMTIDIKQWGIQIVGMQGWNGVYGIGHTWFVTSIILCYLMTPVLVALLDDKNNIKLVVLILMILPLFITYCLENIFVEATLIIPICWYALAFIVGRYYNYIVIRQKSVFLYLSLITVSLGGRLVARKYIDGTTLYDVIICGYTHAIIAFCFFALSLRFLNDRKANRIVKAIDELSYEIYLWHYMFTVGPLTLFGSTPWWITDCILVTMVTIIVALLMKKLATFINQKIEVVVWKN